jgi:anti-sigma regulatory factor (Ser/Thr protein kinase)
MEDRSAFPAELRSATDARHHAERVLRAWGLDAVFEVARLLVSELVVNAVLHAGTGAEMVLRCAPDRVRVEVADRSTQLPQRRAHTTTSPTGRGLLILDDLADEWGVDVTDTGKTVWFELCLPEGTMEQRSTVAAAETEESADAR